MRLLTSPSIFQSVCVCVSLHSLICYISHVTKTFETCKWFRCLTLQVHAHTRIVQCCNLNTHLELKYHNIISLNSVMRSGITDAIVGTKQYCMWHNLWFITDVSAQPYTIRTCPCYNNIIPLKKIRLQDYCVIIVSLHYSTSSDLTCLYLRNTSLLTLQNGLEWIILRYIRPWIK